MLVEKFAGACCCTQNYARSAQGRLEIHDLRIYLILPEYRFAKTLVCVHAVHAVASFFFQPFRCLERSGVNSMSKPQLAVLAQSLLMYLKQASVGGSPLWFREPVLGTTPEDTLRATMPMLPPPEAWVLDFEILREHLPEVAESVIVDWIGSGAHTKKPGRTLYRALQRAMDLGAISGLRGVPCEGDDTTFWLGLM